MGAFSNSSNLSFASMLSHFNIQSVFVVSNMITNIFKLLYCQFINPSRKEHLPSYRINYMVLSFAQLRMQLSSGGRLIRSNRIIQTNGGKEVVHERKFKRFSPKKDETTNGHVNTRYQLNCYFDHLHSVFYCCINNCHRLSYCKQDPFIILQYLQVKSPGMIQWGTVLRFSPIGKKMSA